MCIGYKTSNQHWYCDSTVYIEGACAVMFIFISSTTAEKQFAVA
jgi:hypothetical protein